MGSQVLGMSDLIVDAQLDGAHQLGDGLLLEEVYLGRLGLLPNRFQQRQEISVADVPGLFRYERVDHVAVIDLPSRRLLQGAVSQSAHLLLVLDQQLDVLLQLQRLLILRTQLDCLLRVLQSRWVLLALLVGVAATQERLEAALPTLGEALLKALGVLDHASAVADALTVLLQLEVGQGPVQPQGLHVFDQLKCLGVLHHGVVKLPVLHVLVALQLQLLC